MASNSLPSPMMASDAGGSAPQLGGVHAAMWSVGLVTPWTMHTHAGDTHVGIQLHDITGRDHTNAVVTFPCFPCGGGDGVQYLIPPHLTVACGFPTRMPHPDLVEEVLKQCFTELVMEKEPGPFEMWFHQPSYTSDILYVDPWCDIGWLMVRMRRRLIDLIGGRGGHVVQQIDLSRTVRVRSPASPHEVCFPGLHVTIVGQAEIRVNTIVGQAEIRVNSRPFDEFWMRELVVRRARTDARISSVPALGLPEEPPEFRGYLR